MKRSDLLSINDPMWPKLEHAYGSAADIPDQLRILLKKGPFKKDYWHDLWSSLCHQFCPDTASYAAFPYFVYMAPKLTAKNRFEAMFLASGILACSHYGDDERAPRRIMTTLKTYAKHGRGILADMVTEKRTKDQELIFLSMISAFNGHWELTSSLWSLQQDATYCPECEADIEPLLEHLRCF